MLEVFDKISFVDVDGGAWKQGFLISVDKSRYTAASPLTVFVVPHSHCDPGEWPRPLQECKGLIIILLYTVYV